jgi:hypothetical protein
MKGLGVLLLAILAASPVIILVWLVEADGKADEAASSLLTLPYIVADRRWAGHPRAGGAGPPHELASPTWHAPLPHPLINPR